GRTRTDRTNAVGMSGLSGGRGCLFCPGVHRLLGTYDVRVARCFNAALVADVTFGLAACQPYPCNRSNIAHDDDPACLRVVDGAPECFLPCCLFLGGETSSTPGKCRRPKSSA